jgi:peptidyl-prolyl cis-trans isomerase B (cyclophilin B)
MQLLFCQLHSHQLNGILIPADQVSAGKTAAVQGGKHMNPKVKFTLASGDTLTAELYPDIAPISVDNFLKLVDSGFYNGLTFHRIIPGFMIQGGCPKGDGTGGPGWQIKGEFSKNGVANNLKHTRGVLSMARAANPDSAGSQFFIMHKAAPHLDGSYAAFGKVIEGDDVIDKVAYLETDYSDRPKKPVVIKSVERVAE